jgi:hypothetical protein
MIGVMRALVLLAVGLAAGACSKPAAQPAAPAQPPPKCAQVADHVVSLMSETAQQPTDELDAFRTLVFQHCRDDRWSVQAQDCFLGATSRKDAGDRCEPLLTQDQLTSLTQPAKPPKSGEQ